MGCWIPCTFLQGFSLKSVRERRLNKKSKATEELQQNDEIIGIHRLLCFSKGFLPLFKIGLLNDEMNGFSSCGRRRGYLPPFHRVMSFKTSKNTCFKMTGKHPTNSTNCFMDGKNFSQCLKITQKVSFYNIASLVTLFSMFLEVEIEMKM